MPKNFLSDGWKKEISLQLKKAGLIDASYTGKIVLNISRGAIVDAERTERIK
jgi:hypothetical protein